MERVPVDCSDGDGFTAGEGDRSSAVTAPRVAVMVPGALFCDGGIREGECGGVCVVVDGDDGVRSVVTRDSKPPPDAAVTARVSEPGVPE